MNKLSNIQLQSFHATKFDYYLPFGIFSITAISELTPAHSSCSIAASWESVATICSNASLDSAEIIRRFLVFFLQYTRMIEIFYLLASSDCCSLSSTTFCFVLPKKSLIFGCLDMISKLFCELKSHKSNVNVWLMIQFRHIANLAYSANSNRPQCLYMYVHCQCLYCRNGNT